MNARIAGIQQHSFIDGTGIRLVIFFQGCPHHCPGCHNPETHNFEGGWVVELERIKEIITMTKHIDGITFSGGEPLAQADFCLELTRYIHGLPKVNNVWCYTGWTYEEILSGLAGDAAKALANSVDILIDGRFMEDLRDENLMYRGSSNQRILDFAERENVTKVLQK